jgi:hypothetical protein
MVVCGLGFLRLIIVRYKWSILGVKSVAGAGLTTC